MEFIGDKIKNIKEKNKFYIPNFSLMFEEYLDIFAVFHSTERVHSFLRQLSANAIKFAKINEAKDVFCPLQIQPNNEYVLMCDYGFFFAAVS